MKLISDILKISLFGLGIFTSGCVTSMNHAPIYSKANIGETNTDKTKPFNRQTYSDEQLAERQIRKPLSRRIERQGGTKNLGNEDSIIISKPYMVNGKTYRPRHQPNYLKMGVASWSGKEAQGQPTATGEPFDRHALTAAHPTLPLNALVEVTNLTTGKSLILRANDRGPFSEDRIINVTERAAQGLGFLNSGIAKVRVEYIGAAPPPKTALRADRC